MELLKLLSANEIVAQVIGFLLLLFLLRVFAWKKLLGLLDARKEKISGEYKHIEGAKAELEKLKTEYEGKLSAIEDAAKQKIEEAVAEGKKITEEIRKKAYGDSQDIINNARESIKYELSKAKEELKESIIDLTLRAAENLIEERLTGEGDRKLVNEFLDNVDEMK